MDWDNLRFFLELARSGTLVGAARRLAVDHTTVARRIQALEKQVGTALFSREADGHRLTEAGRRLQPQVESMENAFRTREDLRGHTFISYVDDLLFSKELQYLDELYKPDSFALRSTSILAQHQAALAGAGIAVLPAFIAGRDKSLRRLLPAEASFTRTFWMSVPAETRHLARMKVVWDFLRETVVAQREVLMPPGSAS